MAAHSKSPWGNSAWGSYMRRVKGARHAHNAILASGRKLCEEATRAAAELRKAQREGTRDRSGQKPGAGRSILYPCPDKFSEILEGPHGSH
jgi:hypothetical protein